MLHSVVSLYKLYILERSIMSHDLDLHCIFDKCSRKEKGISKILYDVMMVKF